MQVIRVVYLEKQRPASGLSSLLSFVLFCFYLGWSFHGYGLLFKQGSGCIKTDTLLTLSCLLGMTGFFLLLFAIACIILAVLIMVIYMCCCDRRANQRPGGGLPQNALGNLKKIPFAQGIF